MAKLSLSMIVKNEARDLARCLESVKPVVSEIVVVDTGSTDETPQIAAGLGARVISTPWTNDFSAARNIGLDAATGDWLLLLDADEELPAWMPTKSCRLRLRLRSRISSPGLRLLTHRSTGIW